jgi:hypothetical protein
LDQSVPPEQHEIAAICLLCCQALIQSVIIFMQPCQSLIDLGRGLSQQYLRLIT